MNNALTQLFGFFVGILGEAIVLRFAAKVMLWWDTEMSEEMKAKADLYYNTLSEGSNNLGNPKP